MDTPFLGFEASLYSLRHVRPSVYSLSHFLVPSVTPAPNGTNCVTNKSKRSTDSDHVSSEKDEPKVLQKE